MEIVQMNEETYRIEDGGVRFFLLLGKEKALLVDSGMNVHNAREIAESLTDLPLTLLNTHADIDHIGSNSQFQAPLMSPPEMGNYFEQFRQNGEITPIWDGDTIELGERELKVINIPGHTPGSVALLDPKYQALIAGDSVQDGTIFMFGPQREIHSYLHSLYRLKAMNSSFAQIWPSHGSIPLDVSVIDMLIEGTEKVIAGALEPTVAEIFGKSVSVYDLGGAKLLYNP